MAKPPLTVQNAAITTASVEIKTLTVSGKQVTLAVFRQLLERPLVLEDGTLAGQPWGVVNYHPDKCADSPEHWHVVWQEGCDLRRSRVQVTTKFGEFRADEADRFIASCAHDVLVSGTTNYFSGTLPLEQLAYGQELQAATDHDFPTIMSMSKAGRAAIQASVSLESTKARLDSISASGWGASQVDEAEERFTKALTVFTDEVQAFGATTGDLYARYTSAADEEKQRRDRHTAVRKDLAQLPQLFIAV
ncbi:hypothetical protein [Amycolatopsis sp. DSM 110486]|uniref:hypothetical protein n=1 Tax=Amycolatopsis sp. DSM 110486 TaxID=2865832 RepID=UPI001C6A7FF3|nr:hypothetical protein [Amycolatopsis sp. DSM 110486]QYN19271.1 hypothetical protein K1T34_42675 [Amycolatopsis sp. DSM 110486]